MKKPKLLLAALVLLVGAASAAGSRLQGGADGNAHGALVLFRQIGGF
jgi:hypothetical protein